MKLDQHINKASTEEVYNNIRFIKEAWMEKFDVENETSNIKMETMTTVKRKSDVQQFKEDYNDLKACSQPGEEKTIDWTLRGSVEQIVKKQNPLAYEAFCLLEEDDVIRCKYNPRKIKASLISKRNEQAELKVLRLLNQRFKVGMTYTNSFITSTLKDIYSIADLKNKAGQPRPASPAQLGEPGRFEIERAKPRGKNGTYEHGYTIRRQQFSLAMVA